MSLRLVGVFVNDLLKELVDHALKSIQAFLMSGTRSGTSKPRHITVGESTLGDVLRRYGKPTNSVHVGSTLTISYAHDGIDFLFFYSGNLQTNLPVQAVMVRAKQPLPVSGFYLCTLPQ